MQRRGDEALLGQTPKGIEAAAAGELDGFGIAEGDIAGAVGVGGEEDLPVHLPQQAQKRLGGIRRLPVAAADRTGIDLEDLPCPDQPLHRGACAGRDDGIAGTVREHFYAAPRACADFFLSHGETTVLPTFYCNLTLQPMLQGLENVKTAIAQGAGNLGGLYMEGPYMSGEGSNQNSILWRGEIRPEEYQPLIDAMRGFARIWAIDPARPGIERFMQDVRRADPNAIFALGHSHATAAQCRRVRGCGVKVQTHHGDSGKAPGFAQGTIGAGCDEYTLYDPDMYAELICDETGIHVDPDMLKMVVRTKGVE